MLNTITNMQAIRNQPKRSISALLRAPTQVPDAEKVKHVFQSLGYKHCVTKVLSATDSVTVRTNIQTLGVISIAMLAEKLAASDVDLGFSRSGLILLFKYR